MKIAILTQYYPPEMGAPQARLSDLAQRLVENGHEVTVLTGMPNYPTGRLYPGYRGVFRRESLDGVTVLRTVIVPAKSARFAPRMASYLSFLVSSLLGGAACLGRLDYLMTESPPLFLGVTGFLFEPPEAGSVDFQRFRSLAGERRAAGRSPRGLGSLAGACS